MPLSPSELEIELLCRGARIADPNLLTAHPHLDTWPWSAASGLEVVIHGDSWVRRELRANVPVLEPFVERSPFVFAATEGQPVLVDERDGSRYVLSIPAEPAWYGWLTSRDVPMRAIARLHGAALEVDVNPDCALHGQELSLACRFCVVDPERHVQAIVGRTVADVVETCWAAREVSGVTTVQLTSGFLEGGAAGLVEPYVQAIRERLGVMIGVHLTPEADFSEYDRLIDRGATHFSFSLELFDPVWFARICPGKAQQIGHQRFFDAMAYCAARLPRGAVAGQVIAGLEPIHCTLNAIDAIASIGAVPMVSVFRPRRGSELAAWSPPEPSEVRLALARAHDACRRNRIPLGAVAELGMDPALSAEDGALIAPRHGGFYAYEGWRRLVNLAKARPKAASNTSEDCFWREP